MKYYIFDKEKDDYMKDDDGEKIYFPNPHEVFKFLKNDCQFNNDWINDNFRVDKLDPHEASKVRCDLCTHEWIAVRPEGLTELECPNCKNLGTFENITI